jgi:hypothetical protein
VELGEQVGALDRQRAVARDARIGFVTVLNCADRTAAASSAFVWGRLPLVLASCATPPEFHGRSLTEPKRVEVCVELWVQFCHQVGVQRA